MFCSINLYYDDVDDDDGDGDKDDDDGQHSTFCPLLIAERVSTAFTIQSTY